MAGNLAILIACTAAAIGGCSPGASIRATPVEFEAGSVDMKAWVEGAQLHVEARLDSDRDNWSLHSMRLVDASGRPRNPQKFVDRTPPQTNGTTVGVGIGFGGGYGWPRDRWGPSYNDYAYERRVGPRSAVDAEWRLDDATAELRGNTLEVNLLHLTTRQVEVVTLKLGMEPVPQPRKSYVRVNLVPRGPESRSAIRT